MKKIFIILGLCFVICGCRNNSHKDEIENIMAEKEYVIVDVRTEAEYEEAHVVDAINIPYDEIDESININKDIVIFVYCKSGNRSGIAYNTFLDLGYTVYDLGAFANIDLPKE